MLAQCIQALSAAAGRQLSQAEIDGIEERMLSSMQTLARQDPAAWRAMGRDERYTAAAKLARSRHLDDVTAARSRAVQEMQTRARELKKVDSFKPGLQGQLAALRQRLTLAGNFRGGDIPLEQKIRGVYQDFTRELDGGALKGRFFGLIQNPAEQRAILLAIFGKDSGNPDINALGKQVRDVVERARVAANDVGIPIHHLDDYMPRAWAWEKIGADRAHFIKRALEEINPGDYINRDGSPMTPDQLRRFVTEAAETLGTNGANKRGEGMGAGYGSSVGASRNTPRQLKFKDAEAEIRMAEEFGSASNVLSLLDHHFHGMARDIATARAFGRDADRFVPQLVNRAFAADVSSGLTEGQIKQLDNLKRRTLAEYQALRNPGSPGALPLWAQVSNTVRGIVGSTLLGGSTLAAIPDVGMAIAYGRELGLTRRAIVGNMAEGMKPSAENLAYIRRLGITAQTLQDGTHRFGAGELSNQFTRFLNHGVHVLSLLRMWDRGQIHAISASLMDLLGEHTRRADFAALDPKDQAYLTGRGVTADHFATWQQAELDRGPSGDHTMLTPDAIYSIPDDKLRPIAEARMGAKATPEQIAQDIRRLRTEAAQHLLAVTLAESHIGARGGSGNSVRDNLTLHITPENGGTIMGQVARWLLFLKQTPLGMFRTHMIDVPGGLNDWRSAWSYRARLVAMQASLGALALTLKSIALGQDPDNLLTRKGAAKVAIASGGFGMYGDFLFGDSTEHRNNGLVKLAGPGATFLDDLIHLYGDTEHEASGESSTKPGQYGARLLKFARNYAAPFSRLWYAKAAFNHMIYQQQMEKLSPGYNERTRQRMMRRGQSSWWQPGEMTPDRAPDLGAAVGQPAR
ncbi:hypothetical protein [Dyella ginsengisoli]|uniref:hypothetical protein n=1 Tax=Dyella ginsengisoli TaxID=363848 RepID=UPI00034B00CE|nr:hypothetical protein [Dyella ginsengisoli]